MVQLGPKRIRGHFLGAFELLGKSFEMCFELERAGKRPEKRPKKQIKPTLNTAKIEKETRSSVAPSPYLQVSYFGNGSNFDSHFAGRIHSNAKRALVTRSLPFFSNGHCKMIRI